MLTLFQRSMSMLVCILLFNSVSFAQETTDPTTTKEDPKPKEQPLDKPTEVKEAPKKQDPDLANKSNQVASSVAGGTVAGQSPQESPESKLKNLFQDIPVNLFLGIPIINFPIYTLSESGGASIPLMLNFNSSGMKGQDASQWTGMNFSLSSNQITRITRGLPDEGKLALDTDYTYIERKGFYQHGLKADGDSENDSQADLFFLNINGSSYKFNFDINKKAHFYPEADIEVQVTWTPKIGITNVGDFTNWIVTMPDGTKYFFDGIAREASFEIEAVAASNITLNQSDSYANAESVTSAYYLTKIETAFGHQTNLEYRYTQYSYSRIAEQEATTINCTFNGIDKKINRVFVRSWVPYKYSNGTHVVEFNKGGWTAKNYYGLTYWELNNTYPARRDFSNYSIAVTDTCATSRALHKITVYAKDDPTKVFEWKFKYDFSTGNDPSGVAPFGYSYSKIGYSHQRRFKLRSIEEPDGNKYTFKYYDDTFPLPSRLTQGIDHWGYLNGALSSNIMIGEDAFRVCANGQYGNRSATSGWSQYGTITAISHSTGGTTHLEYENHKARNYTPIIGGSRIKKITFVDSISSLKTVKIYDYKQSDGNPSGFLCLKPVYHFDDKINYTGAPNQFWYSGLYQQLLSESGRPPVGYSRVKETILSEDENDSLGYTVSEFLQPLTEIPIQQVVTYNCVTQVPPAVPFPITTCDTSRYIRPWKWSPYHENTVGVPTRVAVYGKANQILSEKISIYAETQLQGVSAGNGNAWATNYHSFRLVGQNYNFENLYFEFFYNYRLSSETSKLYSQDGTNPVSSTTTYEYKDDLPDYRVFYPKRHNQVVKTSTTDSYGNTVSNWTKYAMDFEFAPGSITNFEVQGVAALLAKGIKTAVIENISRTKQNIFSNDEFVTSATYQTYYKADSAGVKAGMPKSSFVLENVPTLTMTEAYYDAPNDNFTRSSNYDLKSTINSFTTIGLPIQNTNRFGAVSKITYDATYPTLPISQTSNVGQASEQTTSMTYAKILYGVSKQTGVNSLEVNSEYYLDGKLKQLTDKDGKVLKHIQYVYRGQADSDPLLTTNTGYNRIITRIPRIATTTPLTLTHIDCVINVVYMDGAGRVIENVSYRASPNEKDLISGITEYDKFNRPKRTWLSVESTQNTGALLDTAIAKSTARTFYQDQKPYSEVFEYEQAPTSRVFKSYGVGKIWQDSSKYVKMDYLTGTGIKRLFVSNTSDLMSIGTYATYELSKSVSTDERGSVVIEYKDKSGNVVQRDVQVDNTTTYLSTLFAFDPAGRLRFIFPPKAVNALGSSTTLNVESWAEFNENVYSTHYDGRGRVIESHKPGIGWSRAVYNRLNQNCLIQDDDELAKNNTWSYVQTDGLGRTVRTGQMQLPSVFTRDSLQKLFNAFVDVQQFEERSTLAGNIQQYTNRSFPMALRAYITENNWKTHTYYDDYTWTKKSNWDGVSTEADYDFQTHPFGASRYTNSKGLSTGSKIKHEIWGDDNWFSSVNYYDDKNRVIKNITTNHVLKRNQNDFQFNFIGETIRNRSIHRKDGIPDQAITHRMVYDHVGRLKETYYTLSQGTVKKVDSLKMVSNSFDAIGRIKIKFIQPNSNVVSSIQSGTWTTTSIWTNGTIPSLTTPAVINTGHTVTIPINTTVQAGTLYDAGLLQFLTNSKLQLGTLAPVSGAALQVIEYSYNVRSQLRGVNLDANGNPQVSQDKLFSYKLDYHEDNRYFNNTISKYSWKSQNSPQIRSYTYTYDRSNKLQNAQYVGVGNENYSVSTDYDVNGNLQHLQRYSKIGTNTYGLVDNLTYSYIGTGNKLQKVDDAVTGNALANDFRDVGGNDYTYSVDGKITKDGNKGITNIRYNYLDLVSNIKFSNSDSVSYWYSSTGSRIQRKVTRAGQPDSYTIYDGEMVYTFTGTTPSLAGFGISEIQNSEGRYVNGKLEYGYIDHIGNLRLSYKDSLGVAFITQSQSYDPWSNVNAGSEYQLAGSQGDKYLVCGKEGDNFSGNVLLDWRDYDSVIGRMNSYDPADQFQNVSGFAYCGNNPVMYVDPDGRFIPLIIGIGAAIGAGINVYRNWDVINKGGKFDLGKAVGFAAIGGLEGAFIAAAPGAGFVRVAATTFGRAVIGGTFKNIGNGILGGRVDSPTGLLVNSAFSALTAGTFSGLGSVFKGGNFWSGGRVIAEPVIVGQVEKEMIKEGGEKVLEWSDDFAGRKAGEIVNMTDETFSQALFKESIRQTEKIGGYSIYGTKGMVGDVFNRNIFLIETSSKGFGNFKNMISAMEREAVSAGAKKISIFGSSIINKGFLNPDIARRFGYTFQQSGNGAFLQKVLKP
jgi:RHS repeat-associated protein